MKMQPIYEHNGLVAWCDEEVALRRQATEFLVRGIRRILLKTNPAWRFFECETPILTPLAFISPAYSPDDYYTATDGLALRPETTAGSFQVAKTLLNEGQRAPLCVYQIGKSFRREQDKALSNMRLKEFYQLEFQCIYSINTANDYQLAVMPELVVLFTRLLHGEVRQVESDRLPAYSLRTLDIERHDGTRFMELASVSVRTDFSEQHRVLEIAVGMDRVVRHMTEVA